MISSPSTATPFSSDAATSKLFDQSALSTLAQRLVEAARHAGADAADAVAVRGISQGVEVRDGRVLFCEVKSQAGRLSPDQVLWLDALKECDVDYFLLRPDTLDTFLAVIR